MRHDVKDAARLWDMLLRDRSHPPDGRCGAGPSADPHRTPG